MVHRSSANGKVRMAVQPAQMDSAFGGMLLAPGHDEMSCALSLLREQSRKRVLLHRFPKPGIDRRAISFLASGSGRFEGPARPELHMVRGCFINRFGLKLVTFR